MGIEHEDANSSSNKIVIGEIKLVIGGGQAVALLGMGTPMLVEIQG